MRTRLIEMSAAEEATLQRELAEQAREIRDRTERFTRVLLETSDEAGGDDLQRELDRDAAAKGQSAAIPLRNRATPPPEPARAAPTTNRRRPHSGPREIPMRNRRPQPAPEEPAPPSTPSRARCRCATDAQPTPKPAPADEGPRQIDMRNRARDQRKK